MGGSDGPQPHYHVEIFPVLAAAAASFALSRFFFFFLSLFHVQRRCFTLIGCPLQIFSFHFFLNWFHHNPPTVHDPPSFHSDLNAVHPYLSQLSCSIRALHGCPTESPLLQLRHLVIVSAFCSRQQESEMECTLSL